MITPPTLTPQERDLICAILARHPEVTGAILFGSRAKGTAKPASDIDLALEGIKDPVRAQAIASELEALPLPYQFDVKAFATIRNRALLDHIMRVGVRIHGSRQGA